MIGTFENCDDVLYQHAKFGGDRTTRAGCRSENWCFLYVTLGLPALGGQFKKVLCDGLWVDFDAVFSIF